MIRVTRKHFLVSLTLAHLLGCDGSGYREFFADHPRPTTRGFEWGGEMVVTEDTSIRELRLSIKGIVGTLVILDDGTPRFEELELVMSDEERGVVWATAVPQHKLTEGVSEDKRTLSVTLLFEEEELTAMNDARLEVDLRFTQSREARRGLARFETTMSWTDVRTKEDDAWVITTLQGATTTAVVSL